MGAKTKIDWADATWNPVTGCLHGCEYCYARRIAERFRAREIYDPDCQCQRSLIKRGMLKGTGKPLELDYPWEQKNKDGSITNAAYPFGFEPTFHRYRLNEPQKWKKPRNIFVCSMADLFGEWVPDEWIDAIISSTQSALQHRYLFLTKNPKRYDDWLERFEEGRAKGIEEVANCWFGASASTNKELDRANESRAQWLSIEPIRERIATDENQFMEVDPYIGYEQKRWEWVVIGAETGNSKHKIVPKREWVEEIVKVCKEYGTPVFMKESLRGLMGEDFRQEFPWEVRS